MSPSASRQRILRGAAVLVTALSLSAVPTVSSAATASAEPGMPASGNALAGFHGYVECPVVRRGLGCGFEAIVPPGSWIVRFNYRDGNGNYQWEIDSGTCSGQPCPAYTLAVPRLDRTPAGYDVYASAPIVVVGTFVK